MRSGTSYFNKTLYLKNMARFWPIWAVYGLIWTILLPLRFFTLQSSSLSPARLAEEMVELAAQPLSMVQSGVAMSLVFGLAAAMAVFSYLFFSRSACMMHSLPLTRDTLFFTNCLSGISFLVLPHLTVFLLTAVIEAAYGCLNLSALTTWLWVQSATALFFFAFGVFCAMFTGHLLALPAFYGILNILVYAVLSLTETVLAALLYGFSSFEGRLDSLAMWLTPVAKLAESCGHAYIMLEDNTWVWTEQLNSPGTVMLYALAAVVLLLCALWVYHRRDVESAGDVVAIPLVRPLFKYGVALCAGLSFGVWTCAILGLESKVWLCVLAVLWAAVGYFVAEMLLRKSFRVVSAWKGAAVLVCCLTLLFTAVNLDWMGYEDRIPTAEEITKVHMRSVSPGAPYDSGYRNPGLILTTPEEIALIRDVHQAVITEKERSGNPGEEYISLVLEYILSDGTSLHRSYHSVPVNQNELDIEGSVAQTMKRLISHRPLVRQMYGLDELLEDEQGRLASAYLDHMWDVSYRSFSTTALDTASPRQLEQLWQSVMTDFEEGTIGVRYLFDDSPARAENTYTADLVFVWHYPAPDRAEDLPAEFTKPSSAAVSYSREFSITLTPQAEHTLSCLEEITGLSRDDLPTHAQMRAAY